MKKTPSQIIDDLQQKGIFFTTLASKMGVSERTIQRWYLKETTPRPAEEKYLRQIYNGYCANKN